MANKFIWILILILCFGIISNGQEVTDSIEEIEIVPITRTEPTTPPSLLIDWKSEKILKAKECGIELLEVIPMPCSWDYEDETATTGFIHPLLSKLKNYDINLRDNLLSIHVTLDQNCCSGFVAGLGYYNFNELTIDLYEYGMECECDCCFSFDFKIKVQSDFDLEKHKINLAIKGGIIDLDINK
jgi:hypothetical protein